MAGTVMVPVILRISLQPALQRLIRAVRCQRRITAPGRDRVCGCPACNNVVGRYGSITGTWLKPMDRQGSCTPGTLTGRSFCFRSVQGLYIQVFAQMDHVLSHQQ